MSSSRICTNCQAVVPEGHHFCGRCGARFHEGGETEQDDTLFFGAMMAPGRAKLILIQGEGLEGLSYHLNATEHVAGRGNGAILFPDDDYLNKRHATFLYRDNKLYLRDEDSLNGTFMGIREPKPLEDGDVFMVGDQLLAIELLDLQSEYPMHEDTLMYVSPPKDYRFRVVHLLEGAKPCAAHCSVNNDILIGRHGCDVNFEDDRHVSPKHARVVWEDGGPVLKDLDSKNGTYLRVSDEQRLQHGDYVQVGSELLRVEINE
jgi:pSer/pThr/pTyr-binding forkhead associated (FHA) protein